jgi:hydroxypyruvate isomerase
MDLHHCQLMRGDLAEQIRTHTKQELQETMELVA